MSQEASSTHQLPFEVPSIQEMGALLPQYVFEKLAAFGGMGAVYKARQESLDRPVAIKILPPAFGSEPEFAERFKSEARAMAKLNHTNIVAVYDFGITSGGHLYLVMEWVEGPTLHEIIHQGVVPPKKAGDYIIQLCDALSYAHNQRLLHRDIKPGNIMVNAEGRVKVTDFGLARPITGEAEENPYGTPEYAAPEILGKGAVDQRVDIYAAGMVLYEMLTGRVPSGPRRPVTDFAPVSSSWDRVIDMATHPDPEKRLLDARDLRAHVLNLLNRAEAPAVEAVPVAKPAEASPQGPAKKVQPLHLALMGAGGLAIVAIAGVFLFGGDSKKLDQDKVAERREKKIKTSSSDEDEKPRKKRKEDEEQTADKARPKNKPQVAPEVAVAPAKPEAMEAPTPEVETPKKKRAAVEPPEKQKPMLSEVAPAPSVRKPSLAEEVRELEAKDAALAQVLESLAQEWSSNSDISTDSRVRDLAGKYIPALQRSLTGLTAEQRDPILSEISHVANREPLNEPEASWPSVLQSLRQTYNSQLSAIQSASDASAEKVRAEQKERLLAEAGKRKAAGDEAGAKRAEYVASAWSRLKGTPTLLSLKDSIATSAAPGMDAANAAAQP